MCIPNIVGTIVLLTVTPSQSNRGGLLVAFYIMQSYQAQTPLYYQLCSSKSMSGLSSTIADNPRERRRAHETCICVRRRLHRQRCRQRHIKVGCLLLAFLDLAEHPQSAVPGTVGSTLHAHPLHPPWSVRGYDRYAPQHPAVACQPEQKPRRP